ncbi:hypothetical protein ACN27G_36110 [Plantactinospora sp. WMMB334]|uniref:hypothetical protein n=1 Tax=Plantactinospora sp. WMMB334 TaxID=3404119 RepID=UPI003B92CB97
MELRGPISWRIGIRRQEFLIDCALWIRASERIEVPAHRLVPGPLDIDELPEPTRSVEHVPGTEWLGWWLSLVDPAGQRPQPRAGLEPADDTPDPLGLAPWPTLRRVVAERWQEAHGWHSARRQDALPRPGPGRLVVNRVVDEVEQSLGRSVRPFRLDIVLLPVRDDVIRRVDHERYLVPERVHDSPRWPVWLRGLVQRIG